MIIKIAAAVVIRLPVPGIQVTPSTELVVMSSPDEDIKALQYEQQLNQAVQQTQQVASQAAPPLQNYGQSAVTAANHVQQLGLEFSGPCREVYLHTEPSDDSPLITDVALHTWGRPGTSQTWDWSARAMVGQRFVVADRRDGWTAVWFGGHRGWFADPDRRIGASAAGEVITPRPGRDSIPVYGTAYPERSAFPKHIEPDDIVPLQYRIPAGQRYVATALRKSDDYQGSAAHPDNRVHVTGDRQLVEISYNHRRAFVNLDDIHYLT